MAGELPRQRRRDLATFFRYAWVLIHRFRWTIGLLVAAVLWGAVLYGITPHAQLGGKRPDLMIALYASWMALLAQQPLSPPQTWYLAVLSGIYPVLGFLLVGEGLLRLSTLLVSRERGEADWMKVMANTHRDHTILCGLGHLGHRVLEELRTAGAEVVAIEADASCRFMAAAKRAGIPILVRDMRDDQTLIDAGVTSARCIVIATNNDMANVEVALDARRMNPKIRIAMRMFDQQIADKMKGVMHIDYAFSSAALAAPMVAGFVTGDGVLTSYDVGTARVESAEMTVGTHSALAGKSVQEIERAHPVRVIWRIDPAAPADPVLLGPGDTLAVGALLVVHGRTEALAAFRAQLAG